MVVGALVTGVLLAAAVAWSLRGQTEPSPGWAAVRVIGGLGMTALAVQAYLADAPAATLVALPVALTLVASPAIVPRRPARPVLGRPAPLPQQAHADDERKAA